MCSVDSDASILCFSIVYVLHRKQERQPNHTSMTAKPFHDLRLIKEKRRRAAPCGVSVRFPAV